MARRYDAIRYEVMRDDLRRSETYFNKENVCELWQ